MEKQSFDGSDCLSFDLSKSSLPKRIFGLPTKRQRHLLRPAVNDPKRERLFLESGGSILPDFEWGLEKLWRILEKTATFLPQNPGKNWYL